MRPGKPLHMLQMSLDPRQLAALGRRERLPVRQDDLDYLVHAELCALFGESVVQPFRVMGQRSRVEVLGYSTRSADELREHAASYAEPADHAGCDWSTFAGKTMPGGWAAGRRLGFEIRACPVVRLGKEVEVEDKEGRRQRFGRGVEIDAWVHRCFLLDPKIRSDGIGREEVYRDWLGDRLGSAARLESAGMEAFRRRQLVRKRHGGERAARVLERPDALLRGSLTITDGSRFQDLLGRGIGRHKAYGFGMLLVRAPG